MPLWGIHLYQYIFELTENYIINAIIIPCCFTWVVDSVLNALVDGEPAGGGVISQLLVQRLGEVLRHEGLVALHDGVILIRVILLLVQVGHGAVRRVFDLPAGKGKCRYDGNIVFLRIYQYTFLFTLLGLIWF